MEYRPLGRTGWNISEIGFGAWGIGGDAWRPTNDEESLAALNKAIDLGVNFIDTADVYGEGRSERLIAQVRKQRREQIIVATKAGRKLNPHVAGGYNRQNLTSFVEQSLRNLQTDALDLLQLHCPPSEVYEMPEVFGILGDLMKQGKIRYYGVSVERVDEALKAITYPHVQSVQIIFNMFRFKPAEHFAGAVQIVDIYHAREHVWKVARAVFGPNTPATSAWAEQACRSNAARMRYPAFRTQGMQIGSGIVEASCKMVVSTRTKRSGMRWTAAGLDAVLALRTAVLNGTYDAFCEQHSHLLA